MKVDPEDHEAPEPTHSESLELFTGPQVPAHIKFDSLDDSSVAKWVSRSKLRDIVAYNSGFGWLAFDGRRWKAVAKHEVIELVRSIFDDVVASNFRESKDADELKQLAKLLSFGKISTVTELLKGLLNVPASSFDRQRELLNVGNGVLNLRTLELSPHDPRMYITRITETEFIPGSVHPDATMALSAIPEDVRRWLQYRVGQGITGYMVPDDVLPLLHGGGENGKSVFLVSVSTAAGEYATAVPERVLLANPNDHPTELLTLMGVRIGFIEELPDGKHLPVKRLKDLLGTPTLTARAMYKDNIEWSATHSLFVTTNYLPIIDEVDHGTWRRLKIVPFPYKFVASVPEAINERQGDPGLRQRMQDGDEGRSEAILAWIVEGASKVLNDPEVLRLVPDRVEDETSRWRLEVDKIARFLKENIEFDANSWIPAVELFWEFNQWLESRSFAKWNDQTFSQRFGAHQDVAIQGTKKVRISTTRPGRSFKLTSSGLGGQAQAQGWIGIRFKD